MFPVFLSPQRRRDWVDQIAKVNPTALAVQNVLSKEKTDPPEMKEGESPSSDILYDHLLNRLYLAWLEEDAQSAQDVRDKILTFLSDYQKSDLRKAALTQAAVLAWDFGADLWSEEQRKEFAGELETLARSFLEISHGNPHTVTNNWWAITHGACLQACIAADGEVGPNGVIDLADLKIWALERVKAFCAVFGNQGLYHEGSGYIAYTLSMLLPALLAAERHLDPDLLEEFPQFRKSLTSMLVGTSASDEGHPPSENGSKGSALQWNDAGRNCLSLNPFLPGMALAPDKWKGALRVYFDRLLGHESGNDWACPYRGLGFLLAYYPYDADPVEPEGCLPQYVLDQRQGLGMWRSHWGKGDESVFGWYARSTHAGGHKQDDAASIRLISRGRTWICGGGQARAKAQWQSVFTHAHEEDRPKPMPLAHITSSCLSDTNGVVGMDTRASLKAYSERYLSWRTDLDQDFTLAVLDLLDEHQDPPRDWQWNLTVPRDLEVHLHSDQKGFTLIDPKRGQLTARFLLDSPDELFVDEIPESNRTYSTGRKVVYPGDHLIQATYPGRSQARILVGMTVGPVQGDAPGPNITFQDNSLVVDGQVWEQPFSPAILNTVELATSVPNRMTTPAG